MSGYASVWSPKYVYSLMGVSVCVSPTFVNSEQLFKQMQANASASYCVIQVALMYFIQYKFQKWLASDKKLLLEKCSKNAPNGIRACLDFQIIPRVGCPRTPLRKWTSGPFITISTNFWPPSLQNRSYGAAAKD